MHVISGEVCNCTRWEDHECVNTLHKCKLVAHSNYICDFTNGHKMADYDQTVIIPILLRIHW